MEINGRVSDKRSNRARVELDDDLIKIRIDDSETPEFWLVIKIPQTLIAAKEPFNYENKCVWLEREWLGLKE